MEEVRIPIWHNSLLLDDDECEFEPDIWVQRRTDCDYADYAIPMYGKRAKSPLPYEDYRRLRAKVSGWIAFTLALTVGIINNHGLTGVELGWCQALSLMVTVLVLTIDIFWSAVYQEQRRAFTIHLLIFPGMFLLGYCFIGPTIALIPMYIYP